MEGHIKAAAKDVVEEELLSCREETFLSTCPLSSSVSRGRDRTTEGVGRGGEEASERRSWNCSGEISEGCFELKLSTSVNINRNNTCTVQ